MSSNNTRIVKQWIPQPHDAINEASVEESIHINGNTVAEAVNEKHHVKASSSMSEQEIINNALIEAEEIKKSAYKQGYETGISEAKKKLDDIKTKQKEIINNITNEVYELKERINHELEDKTLKLSIDIAEKIVNMKLESDDKVFVGIVRNSIAMMDTDEKLTLKLNHREYEKYFKNSCESLYEELQCGPSISVVQDRSISEGGLILESEKGFVNAGVDIQLKRLANSITQRDKQYHEAL